MTAVGRFNQKTYQMVGLDKIPVSVERLELSTNGLKGHCSAIELHARRAKFYHAPLAESTASGFMLFPPAHQIGSLKGNLNL
jgi:hypothetical protein